MNQPPVVVIHWRPDMPPLVAVTCHAMLDRLGSGAGNLMHWTSEIADVDCPVCKADIAREFAAELDGPEQQSASIRDARANYERRRASEVRQQAQRIYERLVPVSWAKYMPATLDTGDLEAIRRTALLAAEVWHGTSSATTVENASTVLPDEARFRDRLVNLHDEEGIDWSACRTAKANVSGVCHSLTVVRAAVLETLKEPAFGSFVHGCSGQYQRRLRDAEGDGPFVDAATQAVVGELARTFDGRLDGPRPVLGRARSFTEIGRLGRLAGPGTPVAVSHEEATIFACAALEMLGHVTRVAAWAPRGLDQGHAVLLVQVWDGKGWFSFNAGVPLTPAAVDYLGSLALDLSSGSVIAMLVDMTRTGKEIS